MAKLPPEPVKAEPAPAPVVKKVIPSEAESAEPPPLEVVLKPSKAAKKSGRDPASAKGSPDYKKICVGKNDISAPEILRGKCATRSCVGTTCTYQGRKEMFEWAAR
ncbi:hypothetical protein D3C72_1941120 [compost metagenome]